METGESGVIGGWNRKAIEVKSEVLFMIRNCAENNTLGIVLIIFATK